MSVHEAKMRKLVRATRGVAVYRSGPEFMGSQRWRDALAVVRAYNAGELELVIPKATLVRVATGDYAKKQGKPLDARKWAAYIGGRREDA